MKAPDISLEAVFWLLEELPAITEFGDLHRYGISQNVKKKIFDSQGARTTLNT
jgi:hypothetical protein